MASTKKQPFPFIARDFGLPKYVGLYKICWVKNPDPKSREMTYAEVASKPHSGGYRTPTRDEFAALLTHYLPPDQGLPRSMVPYAPQIQPEGFVYSWNADGNVRVDLHEALDELQIPEQGVLVFLALRNTDLLEPDYNR